MSFNTKINKISCLLLDNFFYQFIHNFFALFLCTINGLEDFNIVDWGNTKFLID